MQTQQMTGTDERVLSLYQLLDPEVMANPYPLYAQLRSEDPVYWDPFLHAWVVTHYVDVIIVLQRFSANRTPTPEQLEAMGLGSLRPLAQLTVRQMLFLAPPAHGRVRGLASKAFTPRRVEVLRVHIQDITDRLLDDVQASGHMDVIANLGRPLPAIVTGELLGLPTSDWEQLTTWSTDFAQVLGNFQHNPDRQQQVLRTVEEITAHFQAIVQEQRIRPCDGLISAMIAAEVDGDRLSDEEIVANVIITMVGGQETTTNLIGNGILSLLRYSDQLEKLKATWRDNLDLRGLTALPVSWEGTGIGSP